MRSAPAKAESMVVICMEIHRLGDLTTVFQVGGQAADVKALKDGQDAAGGGSEA